MRIGPGVRPYTEIGAFVSDDQLDQDGVACRAESLPLDILSNR